ncbi:unnamed protein product [Cuscuta campestris]|uniref:Cytochrome c oxidase copper chaperone n=1 Tax=Cuscuta campestris TaxID=132261 RepID=A0A484NNY5_9ASTE|nr:unnamed protein product [Cuscuta campestris]
MERRVEEKNDKEKPLADSLFTTRVHLTPFPRKRKDEVDKIEEMDYKTILSLLLNGLRVGELYKEFCRRPPATYKEAYHTAWNSPKLKPRTGQRRRLSTVINPNRCSRSGRCLISHLLPAAALQPQVSHPQRRNSNTGDFILYSGGFQNFRFDLAGVEVTVPTTDQLHSKHASAHGNDEVQQGRPNRRTNSPSRPLFFTMAGLPIESTPSSSCAIGIKQSPKDQSAATAVVSDSKPKKKICCACPETKKLRDECIVEHGESACQKWIEAHRICLRAEGFNV